MGLTQLSHRIYYLEHDPEVDRPMLAYIQGDKYSLAIDAGYSFSHVTTFYNALENCGLDKPSFTVLTHWHYDHTFGLHAINGISIALEQTNAYLKQQQIKAKDNHYIDWLKENDVHFQKEYADINTLNIVLSDITFTDRIFLDLGGISAHVFHAISPHSLDCVCIYIPEEKVLFLGDATSEDFFNDGYIDYEKLKMLIHTIEQIDCQYCILSHCEPLTKSDLLAYLYSLI